MKLYKVTYKTLIGDRSWFVRTDYPRKARELVVLYLEEENKHIDTSGLWTTTEIDDKDGNVFE